MLSLLALIVPLNARQCVLAHTRYSKSCTFYSKRSASPFFAENFIKHSWKGRPSTVGAHYSCRKNTRANTFYGRGFPGVVCWLKATCWLRVEIQFSEKFDREKCLNAGVCICPCLHAIHIKIKRLSHPIRLAVLETHLHTPTLFFRRNTLWQPNSLLRHVF